MLKVDESGVRKWPGDRKHPDERGRPAEQKWPLRLFKTIRARMLFAFLFIGVLPAVVIGAVASSLSGFEGRRQAVELLNLAADFKESQVETWAGSMLTDLDTALTKEDNILYMRILLEYYLESESGRDVSFPQDLQATLERLLVNYAQEAGPLEDLFLMRLNGQVVASSNKSYRKYEFADQAFFQQGLRGPYFTPPSDVPGLGGWGTVVTEPVLSSKGEALGVFAGHASMAALDEIMTKEAELGTTGKSYLVGSDGVILTGLSVDSSTVIVARTSGAGAAIQGQRGWDLYNNYAGEPVVGVYRWLPQSGVAMLVEQRQLEAFAGLYTILGVNIGVILLSGAAAIGIALLLTRSISDPLANLVDTAEQIAAGDLNRVARVEREDEVGTLARAFNSMTTQLRDSIGTLEDRVTERTQALARRSVYLEASARVGQAVTSILNAEQLASQVVELIRERFQLYYVGLFQLDESGEWAVLQAGTGEYGRRMMARGHRIEVGKGMVGWSIANNQSRTVYSTAADAVAGQDAVRLTAPELPDTRSEAALPMRSRGHVIGALTVQSEQENAFDEDALVVLQTMADQVAVALDNARLFTQVQEALESARQAYGDMSRQAWVELLRRGREVAFRSNERGVVGTEPAWLPEAEQAIREGRTVRRNAAPTSAAGGQIEVSDTTTGLAARGSSLAIPIRIGQDVVGVMNTFKSAPEGDWTEQEVAWLESVTEQLAFALEAARFFQETQLREIRERQIREIGANMQARVSMDALMQTAVADLARALNVSSAFVQLNTRSRPSNE